MTELTVADLHERIVELEHEIAELIRTLKRRQEKVYANVGEPIAINAAEVARLLSIKRDQVYQLHHAGVLNGFRPYPNSHLKFLVSEVREVATRMAAERRNT